MQQQQAAVAQRVAAEAAEKLRQTVLQSGGRVDSSAGPFELWLTPPPNSRAGRPLPRSEGLMPDTGHHQDPSAIGAWVLVLAGGGR